MDSPIIQISPKSNCKRIIRESHLDSLCSSVLSKFFKKPRKFAIKKKKITVFFAYVL